jgi:hypothetical protein
VAESQAHWKTPLIQTPHTWVCAFTATKQEARAAMDATFMIVTAVDGVEGEAASIFLQSERRFKYIAFRGTLGG